MKKIITNKFLVIFAAVMVFATSCEDYLGGDINENPNSPAEVPPTVILPAAQVFIADLTGGAFSRFSSILVQQTEGVARQWTSINNYSSMNPATFNTAWNNMYENVLVELKEIERVSIESGFGNYQGVNNVLLAYSLMMATDVWDDIPYTEAFQGFENISANFDDQTVIYAEIERLLTEAVPLLLGGDGTVPVRGEDLIYEGSMSKWVRAANSLRARMHMHLGEYDEALTAAAGGFTSSDDDLEYTFPNSSAASPWFRFNRDRTGDIELHPTFVGIMENTNDTIRRNVLNFDFDEDHPFLTAVFTQEMMTYRELKFIEAEALLRTSGSANEVRDAYLAGIRASFDWYGASEDAYNEYVSQADVDGGIGNITLEDIMIQKYTGLFSQPEVYNDWRRTDVPDLNPTAGTLIPVRFPIGNDEILLNENAPREGDIDLFSDKVGWDN